MANTRSTCRTKIQNFHPGLDENIIQSTQNTGSQLGPERIPHPVLYFRAFDTSFDTYTLFTIDGFTRDDIFGYEERFFAFCDEDSGMAMGLEDDV